jgi:hypothetical protein
MQVELMNCAVDYEDPEEEKKHDIPISSSVGKTVTWKSAIATTFKTPQECVGQNGNHKNKRGMDRHPCSTRHTRVNHSGTLGTARLVRAVQQVEASREKISKQ